MESLAQIHQAVQAIEQELPPEAEALVQQYLRDIRQALIKEWARHIHAQDA